MCYVLSGRIFIEVAGHILRPDPQADISAYRYCCWELVEGLRRATEMQQLTSVPGISERENGLYIGAKRRQGNHLAPAPAPARFGGAKVDCEKVVEICIIDGMFYCGIFSRCCR